MALSCRVTTPFGDDIVHASQPNCFVRGLEERDELGMIC